MFYIGEPNTEKYFLEKCFTRMTKH